MDPDKVSGHNRFNLRFYHFFSHVIGDGVFQAGRGWLEEEVLLEEVKETNVVLSPKAEEPNVQAFG
ncbi:hypothetical protein LINPERHAP1_LOCUS17180 [Linum perenne]